MSGSGSGSDSDSDNGSGTDWAELEAASGSNSNSGSPLASLSLNLPQRPLIKKLDDMTSFLSSATLAVPTMKKDEFQSDDMDDFDDFDDFEEGDEIVVPPSMNATLSNGASSHPNLPQSSARTVAGNKSGPTLITLEDMTNLVASSKSAKSSNHTRQVSEVSEEDCFDDFFDDDDDEEEVTGFDSPDAKSEKNNMDMDSSKEREAAKDVLVDQSLDQVVEKDEIVPKKEITAPAPARMETKSFLSTYASKEDDDADNWDDEFDLAGSSTGQQILRGSASRPMQSPFLRQALTKVSSSGSTNAMASVYRKQASPLNVQSKAKMTLFTLPATPANTVPANGNSTTKIHLHTLPAGPTANQGSGMTYDASQQKWIETGGSGAHEEVDWGSDDENEDATNVKEKSMDANLPRDGQLSGGDKTLNGGKTQKASTSPPPSDTQSHNRVSTTADFDICPELKAALMASEIFHHNFFNNFLGPEEYTHYINKFSKGNYSVASSKSLSGAAKSRISTTSVNHKNGDRRSVNNFLGKSSADKTSSTSSRGNTINKRAAVGRSMGNNFDVLNYRIPSATKIGSRKQNMLTEIWEVTDLRAIQYIII